MRRCITQMAVLKVTLDSVMATSLIGGCYTAAGTKPITHSL